MQYAEYSYLYPPRPEKRVAPATIPFLESQGYWAQIKRNGDCTLIFAKGDDVRFMNRHDQTPTRWSPKDYHREFFKGFPEWNVFVGERIGDTLYLFDQIVHKGEHLVGSTFEDRQALIHSMWVGTEEEFEVRINEWLTVAKSFKTGFKGVFDRLTDKDEGLVMKRPKAKLDPCFRDKQNGGWQVKVRRTTLNYTF